MPAIASHTNNAQGQPTLQANSGAQAMASSASRPTRLAFGALQRTSRDVPRAIAQFLTLTEAIHLMLVSTRLHSALQHDPHLRLDELSPYMQSLPLFRLLEQMRILEKEIAQLQDDALRALRSHQRPQVVQHVSDRSSVAGSVPNAVWLGMYLADRCLELHRTRARVLAWRQEDLFNVSAVRARRESRDLCRKELQVFEPEVESVFLHFIRQRHAPRKGEAQNVQQITHAIAASETLQGVLQETTADAHAAMEIALLQEFLSLPARLMPNARKVEWLCQPGLDSHEWFLRSTFGSLQPLASDRLDAYANRVRIIVGSKYLDQTDKEQVVTRPRGLNIFDLATKHDNYGVAALLLLGIHESSAQPQVKDFLLAPIFNAWRGTEACVDFVGEMLGRHEHRAPDWIVGVLGRLNAMKLDLAAAERRG